MTENELRSLAVETAESFLGCCEADGSHKKIIDLYNTLQPLPAGYAMSYTDPWCAAFVSAVGIRAGIPAILPECSCERMIALYGDRAEEMCFAAPKKGDVLMYDWDDNGSADHVGLIAEVKGDSLRVIEGNLNDAVGKRSIPADSPLIRCCCKPDYLSLADAYVRPDTADTPELAAASPASAILTLPFLRAGDIGDTVKAAQAALIARGCRCGPCGTDGEFGAATQGAVQSFQRVHGLPPDGVIGEATWKTLLAV